MHLYQWLALNWHGILLQLYPRWSSLLDGMGWLISLAWLEFICCGFATAIFLQLAIVHF